MHVGSRRVLSNPYYSSEQGYIKLVLCISFVHAFDEVAVSMSEHIFSKAGAQYSKRSLLPLSSGDRALL